MGTNPKVTAASVSALVASVLVTFLTTHVHALNAGSSLPVVTGLVTLVATYGAGYARSCLTWAEEYVAGHRAPTAVTTPSVPLPVPVTSGDSSNKNSSGDWA